MFKEIKFDAEARNEILKGVDLVAKAVGNTLGPQGNNVIFEESSYPTITKDGVTVAGQIFLSNKLQNMGVMMAREAAENTNREAGDGTTTTIVLLQAILKEGHKAVAAGMNPILIKRGMDVALNQVLDQLQAKQITTDKEKLQIATISANNDEKIGKMIADVIKKVGTDGVITVSNSNSLKTEVEYLKGTKLNSGFESHVFINDPKRLSVMLEEPVIIITREDILMQNQLVPIIQRLLEAGKNKMVLLANKIEGNALAFLVQNWLQGKFMCVPVKLPAFGGYQRDLVYDLAALTQATVLGPEDAVKLEDGTLEHCGSAEKIIIGRKETIISGGEGDISKRIEEIKALLKEEKDIFNKEKLKDRLGRLTGSIANIKAGGASETEQMELRYRIEDSLNSTKSAIEEGIVEGGGVALLRCDIINTITAVGEEFDMGIKIVQKALEAPLKKIVDNSGQSGEAVVAKVKEATMGYNALTGKYEDLFQAGIVDPLKVVKNEIINAVATSGILLTSNTAITIIPEKK